MLFPHALPLCSASKRLGYRYCKHDALQESTSGRRSLSPDKRKHTGIESARRSLECLFRSQKSDRNRKHSEWNKRAGLPGYLPLKRAWRWYARQKKQQHYLNVVPCVAAVKGFPFSRLAGQPANLEATNRHDGKHSPQYVLQPQHFRCRLQIRNHQQKRQNTLNNAQSSTFGGPLTFGQGKVLSHGVTIWEKKTGRKKACVHQLIDRHNRPTPSTLPPVTSTC